MLWAEQWEAGEPRRERQTENDQQWVVQSAGEHQPGAGAGPGTAGYAAGTGLPATTGERNVRISIVCINCFPAVCKQMP